MTRAILSLLLLAAAAVPSLADTELVAGIHVIRGHFTPGSQPDGNTIILEAPEGLVVIDTGRHAAHTQVILDFAKRKERPIAAVINTHWHLDHIGGNLMVRAAYPAVRVFASSALTGARTGFLANYRRQLQALLDDPKTLAAEKTQFEAELKLIDGGAQLAPDVVITGPGVRTIAGRPLHVGLETHAVTAGDLWVLDAKTGVLVAGDLVTLPAPFLDTACPARWGESLDRVSQLNFELLVPGHGAPMTRRQFATYRTAFRDLVACTGEKAACIDGWLSTVAPLTAGSDQNFTRSMVAYYVDLLRREPAAFAELCGAQSSSSQSN